MTGRSHLPEWMRRLLLLAFLFSGSSGLIYELAWTRRLTRIFGSTTLAVSTVLAAFMGGLALGSYLLGRYADRQPKKALQAYGVLELSIGLLALSVPLLFRGVGYVYLALAPSLERSPQIFFLIQFFLVAAVIVLPTSLMGGTLPLLSRFLVIHREEVGGRVGVLYAANTLGAAIGTAAATYALLPEIGEWRTEVCAALLNLAAGAVALLVQRRLAPSPEPAADTESTGASAAGKPSLEVRILLLGIALSGFAAMVYEVAWSRTLAIVLGSSVYAFGMMLLVFLIGLSAGSALFTHLPKRSGQASAVLALVLAGNTVAGLFAIALVPRLPILFLWIFPLTKDSFFRQQLLQFLVTASLLLPSAMLFGMAFPAVIAATTESARRVGRSVGRVNAVNTVGTVVGAFLGGFVLIPQLGLRATLMAAAIATAGAGLAVLWLARAAEARWRRGASAAVGAALLAAALVPPWPRKLLASGPGFYGPKYRSAAEFLASLRDMELLFYKDGVNTTLSVDRWGDHRYYRSNGKTDASTYPSDLAVQLLLGQVPMLLHPNPQDVFDLGLGTGISAAAVARYPVRSIDIVDIEPAGQEAVHFFDQENRRILSDPRVHFLAADGRNALLARSRTYDVIICDPSDVWVAGVANLFTREFYELVRSRLKPGGVFVQWWHTHALHPDHMKLVVATFRRVFPHASYWRANRGDVMMVGSVEPLAWDYERLRTRFQTVPGVAEDLRGIGIWHPMALFAALVLDGDDLARLVADVRGEHTDDRPVVEFYAPRFLYTDTATANEAMVTALQTQFFPPMTNFDPARDLDPMAVYLLGFGHASLGRTDTAIKLMEDSVARDPKNARCWIGLANQYRAKGLDDSAMSAYRQALLLVPAESEATVNLAALLSAKGNNGEAETVLRAGLSVTPEEPATLTAIGKLLLETGRSTEALSLLEPAAPKHAANGELRLLLGRSLKAAGRREEALTRLREACALAPKDPAIQAAAAGAFLELGDLPGAVEASQRATAVDPNNVDALLALAEASHRRGDRATERAARERAQNLPVGRRAFPPPHN